MERRQFRPRWPCTQKQVNSVTPVPLLFGKGKRNTDPLKMQDEYQRANASIWETGQRRVPGGFPAKTFYDIKPGQHIFSSLNDAATEHVFARTDRNIPRKAKLGRSPFRDFRYWMLSGGFDPDEGYTYARQGDENTTPILIELDPTIADTVIICYH
jgi:hypothetical protein